jgi:AraC-like DNA-binding protein
MECNNSVKPADTIVMKVKIGSIVFDIILNNGFFNPSESYNVEKHRHPAYEIHFIMKGTCLLEVEGKEWNILAGNYCIIGPNVHHKQNIDESIPIIKYTLRIEYNNSYISQDFFPIEESCEIENVFKNIKFFISRNSHNNVSLVYEIINELRNQQVGYYTKVYSLFSLLIINIVRDVVSNQKSNYQLSNILQFKNRNFIIENFFEYNYNRKVSTADLAELLNISTRHLNRILQDNFHMSFKEKVLEKRMEVAKNLLLTTDLSAKTIANMVGYSIESNFYILFKKKNGCTPSEYRALHKDSNSIQLLM